MPTEQEKVWCCKHLGIGKDRLPQRIYAGAAGRVTRYFHLPPPWPTVGRPRQLSYNRCYIMTYYLSDRLDPLIVPLFLNVNPLGRRRRLRSSPRTLPSRLHLRNRRDSAEKAVVRVCLTQPLVAALGIEAELAIPALPR